ncbi:hypothetical protein PR003_g27696 [Phytophthora rubi]|uniref:Uncharacterized protein n=1 Tax=Phytophthora rubi TaxID=129364 RepID=A0A6A4C5H3_9STRA|nr:hypothetical protein PR003_g27696 [Phytophthora rubi]
MFLYVGLDAIWEVQERSAPGPRLTRGPCALYCVLTYVCLSFFLRVAAGVAGVQERRVARRDRDVHLDKPLCAAQPVERIHRRRDVHASKERSAPDPRLTRGPGGTGT